MRADIYIYILYITNICPQCRLPSMSHDIEGKYFNFSRIMSKNANFQTLGPKGPQKPPNLHIIPNVGSINPIKYVLSPNRNPQNCIFSPTLGPKGPQKPSKCMQKAFLHTFTFTMTGACLQTQQSFSKIMMRLTIFFQEDECHQS